MPPTDEKKPELVSVPEANMTDLVSAVLNDVLHNIISDAVMKVHRDEKLLRMQSAAIQVQQAAEKMQSDETKSNGPPSITKTGAAMAEDGKIYLRGNPLATTTTITCPNCRLPRLLSHPADPRTEYCAKKPYHSTPNHDIHGNPFPSDKATKSKLANSTKKSTATSPPLSSSPPSSSSPPLSNTNPATAIPTPSFPTTKCPNCPRYLIITRIAQHLEKCMGIAGRQSSRNAMAKMRSETPKESRAETPRLGKTVGVGAAGKAGDKEKEKEKGAGAGVEKTGKVVEKEKAKGKGKGKKRRFNAEDEEGPEEKQTPKKKKKTLLKKRGAEKTVPPTKQPEAGAAKMQSRPNGEPNVAAQPKERDARES